MTDRREISTRIGWGGNLLFLACLGVISCGRGHPLPDLPQVSTEAFTGPVREQVRQAYEAARAHPEDAEANGKLGMVLHAYELHEAAAIWIS